MALHLAERRALLVLGDVVAVVAALVLSLWLDRISGIPGEGGRLVKAAWLLVLGIAWLIAAAVNSCYDVRIASRFLPTTRMLAFTLLATSLVYAGLFFVFGRPIVAVGRSGLAAAPAAPPRVAAGIFLITLVTGVSLWRGLYTRLAAGERLRRRLLVVGAGRSGRTLAAELSSAVDDVAVVGFVDDDPAKVGTEIEGVPVLGTSDHLLELVRDLRADEVVLAVGGEIGEPLAERLLVCYEARVMVRGMSEVFEDALGRVPVEYLGRTAFPSLLTKQTGLPTVQRVAKRSFDLVAGAFGLAVFLVALPFVAAAIVLDSGRPVFYSQPRLGRSGRVFKILKFRSMVTIAEENGEEVWAAPDDPRVTRVGRFLRVTRLDELPQVLNVLRGEMSVVGPRPERPQLVARLAEEIPFYRARLAVKPGLTGWAQINHGYANTVAEAMRKLQYDLYYIKRQGLWLDLLVMMRTVRVVLSFDGT